VLGLLPHSSILASRVDLPETATITLYPTSRLSQRDQKSTLNRPTYVVDQFPTTRETKTIIEVVAKRHGKFVIRTTQLLETLDSLDSSPSLKTEDTMDDCDQSVLARETVDNSNREINTRSSYSLEELNEDNRSCKLCLRSANGAKPSELDQEKSPTPISEPLEEQNDLEALSLTLPKGMCAYAGAQPSLCEKATVSLGARFTKAGTSPQRPPPQLSLCCNAHHRDCRYLEDCDYCEHQKSSDCKEQVLPEWVVSRHVDQCAGPGSISASIQSSHNLSQNQETGQSYRGLKASCFLLDLDLQKSLWEAVRRNDLVGVRAFLQKGALPDFIGGPSTARTLPQTPLCVAASNNNLEIVSLLLRYGADPNIVVPGSYSPLRYSCWTLLRSDTMNEEQIALLLSQGAKIGVTDVACYLVMVEDVYALAPRNQILPRRVFNVLELLVNNSPPAHTWLFMALDACSDRPLICVTDWLRRRVRFSSAEQAIDCVRSVLALPRSWRFRRASIEILLDMGVTASDVLDAIDPGSVNNANPISEGQREELTRVVLGVGKLVTGESSSSSPPTIHSPLATSQSRLPRSAYLNRVLQQMKKSTKLIK
jgi:hypothetical protein